VIRYGSINVERYTCNLCGHHWEEYSQEVKVIG